MKKTKTDGHWSSETASDDELRAILGDAVAEQVIAARKGPPGRGA